MDGRVQLAQLGLSLSSLPQMGMYHSKFRDGFCWKANVGGDLSRSCAIFGTQCWPSYPSAIKPFLAAKSSQKVARDEAKKQRTQFLCSGNARLIRQRMSSGIEPNSRSAGARRTVRLSVNDATAHSADVELGSSELREERGDGMSGIQDVDLDYGSREVDDQPEAKDTGLSAEAEDRIWDGEEFGICNGSNGSLPTTQQSESGRESSSVDSDQGFEDMMLGGKKDWSMEDMKKMDLLKSFEFRQTSENGVFAVQAMRVEHMRVTEELLVDSFAELVGGLLTYRPLLALTVRQYMRDRYECLPNAVTLVAMLAPPEAIVVNGTAEDVARSSRWMLAGTVEVSFSNVGHPDIPAGPAPPPGSPYLCNMAISAPYRRKGLGRQLLKAAEELAVSMGAQDMYLHCRMIDSVPLNMYTRAGYKAYYPDERQAKLLMVLEPAKLPWSSDEQVVRFREQLLTVACDLSQHLPIIVAIVREVI